jgi:ketosteroid isomerase-like protein
MVGVTSAPTDSLLIRETLEGLYFCIDNRDIGGLDAFCAEDIVVTSDVPGWKTVTGRERLKRGFDRMVAGGVLGIHSNHTFSNIQITADGDVGHSASFLVAFLAAGTAAEGRIIMRGIRYETDYVRVGGRWLIGRHAHKPLWQCEAPSLPLALPSSGTGGERAPPPAR